MFLLYTGLILFSIVGIMAYLYFNHQVDINPIIEELENIDIRVINRSDIKNLENKRDWDIVVNDNTIFDDVMNYGTLGLGEGYMNKKWDCDNLDILFDKILFNNLDQKIKLSSYLDYIKIISAYLFNQQTKEKAYEVEDVHYNLDNNLYRNMLGETMAYSCGYWKNAFSLDEAQYNKFELICKKLHLTKEDNVLDIGSGFGGLAKYMAEKYGCKVTGVNISTEQLKYARESCKELIKDELVNFVECDYRDIPLLDGGKQYDKIVSVGFMEHVGLSNYQTLINKCNELLKDGGLLLLHTIGNNVSTVKADSWIDKYIFPNGMLPSITQIGQVCENIFVMEDWHNFGPDYDKTLMAWYNNYTNSITAGWLKHTDKFYRMWIYYLLQCAGLFRSRSIQLWQIVLSKQYRGVYETTR